MSTRLPRLAGRLVAHGAPRGQERIDSQVVNATETPRARLQSGRLGGGFGLGRPHFAGLGRPHFAAVRQRTGRPKPRGRPGVWGSGASTFCRLAVAARRQEPEDGPESTPRAFKGSEERQVGPLKCK